MTEFALSGYHPSLEPPVNPWNADHWSGVSSSGSGVATAARLCCASIGTDTGGSIRLPCAANGVVGIKPTYGRVSRHKVFPLAESLDHIGPMAGCVEDAALVLNAIAGFDLQDPTSLNTAVPDFTSGIGRDINGLRIGIDHTYNAQVDSELATALRAAQSLKFNGIQQSHSNSCGGREWFWRAGPGAVRGVQRSVCARRRAGI